MDIYCKRCGEPWDYLGAADAGDMTRTEYTAMMAGEGCPSCAGKPLNKPKPFRAMLMDAVSDLLGDDIDGIASSMDDAEFMFGSEFWDD